MAEETDILTIRIPKSLKSYIDKRSKEKQVSINSLVNTMLSQKLYWNDYLSELGWMYFHPGIVKWLFSTLSKDQIRILNSSLHKDILTGIQFLYEEPNAENIVKFIRSWLDSSNTPYRYIPRDGVHKFIVTHNLGANWSMFASGIIEQVVTTAGFGIRSVEYDESQYSFEILPVL